MTTQFVMLLVNLRRDFHLNILYLDGLSGQKHKLMFGTIFLEFKLNNHQLMYTWVIEHLDFGLVK